MASDIQPGDLVVCVDGCRELLRAGGIYRIATTYLSRLGHPSAMLSDGPLSSSETGGWYLRRFRKLNDEPDNIELIERIKACKPISEPAIASSTGRRG